MSQNQAAQQQQRRRHYRVDVNLNLRLKVADVRADGRRDEIDHYEELSAAANRYRKELPPTGRQFMDRLMRTLDVLTAELAERRGSAGWCPRVVVEADLSAGGVGFLWDSFHAPGTVLDVEFSIHDVASDVPFQLRCIVMRAQQRKDAEGFELGLEFDEMPQASQQRLVRALLDLQRVQLRERSRRR